MTELARIPDVLETLAQLPNDEVFTHPKWARAMLDVLPAEVWSNPDFKWLDPATKSGVFLREIYRRLMGGLVASHPDAQDRREHILREMLFGAPTTEITGQIARRTLYQTYDATGAGVVDSELDPFLVRFSDSSGNVPFVPTEHEFAGSGENRRCRVCGAPEALVRDDRQAYAYPFIHGTYPPEELLDMKFDVVVGNPPYQIGVRDNTRDRPIYQLFVEQAIAMEPRYVLMITPSRWFSGGLGLDEFRAKMISDRRIRIIVDNPKIFDVFPGVKIRGGVSWFLWDKKYNGDCEFSTRIDGKIVSEATRDLRDGEGVLVRDNRAAEIIQKVRSVEFPEGSLADVVSAGVAFGDSFRTNYKGAKEEPFDNAIPLIFGNKIGFVRLEQLERNLAWVGKWKVLIPNASSGDTPLDDQGRVTDVVLGEPIALAPGSACTQTYLVAGTFDTREETENYAKYLTSKFVRFLVLQRKTTQHVIPDRFRFVPWLDFTREWTDSDLYSEFGLNEQDVEYVEATIKARNWNNSLDSPIPATHLPGGRKYGAKGDDDAPEVEAE